MSAGVDLHAHTTASDGTLSPRELVRLAVRHGVRVLAVTDHDSTEGLGEALAEAALYPPLEIVPGLEINCDVDGSEVHVDRKSTRLNSSHSQISYAVFCLKKQTPRTRLCRCSRGITRRAPP